MVRMAYLADALIRFGDLKCTVQWLKGWYGLGTLDEVRVGGQ